MNSLKYILVVVLVLIGMTSAMAQGISSAILYTVNVSTVALGFTATGTTQYDNLVRGVTYTSSADAVLIAAGTSLTPIVNLVTAETASATVETNVTGDPGANILVTFTLPTMLQDITNGGMMPITYAPYSASWGLTTAESNLFDPRTPSVIPLDATGNAFIVLTGDVTVPLNAAASAIFTGSAIISVNYTGL